MSYWRRHGRHNLPWRKTQDPYKILVSEMMLQQTQVSRVIPKYEEFLKKFPTVQALAKAPLIEVLRVWSGLGYNRRAKFLHDAAKQVAERHDGHFPREYAELRALPGVGDYTAKAIQVFSLNESELLLETNIRTVYLHTFFSNTSKVSDRKLHPYVERAARGQNPRTWHWALMDYGAHLKKSGVKLNSKSAHYTKQSKFEGSLRQMRGAILRAHAKGDSLSSIKATNKQNFEKAFTSLVRDGLVPMSKGGAS